MRTRCRIGETVIACRQLVGMDVPVVPVGSSGTVVAATLLGRPKRVLFTVNDGWGTKRFELCVRRGDVERRPETLEH